MQFQLKAIPVWLNLGVPESERVGRQKILVTCDFAQDSQKAEISDEIKDTVDYFEVYKAIQSFPQDSEKTEFCLLEHFMAELRESLQKKFPELENIALKVEKFPFPEGSVVLKK